MRPDYFLDDDEEDVTGSADGAPEQPAAADTRQNIAGPERAVPRRRSGGWKWAVLTIGVMLGVTAYLRYGTPYVTDATDEVYILSVQREGLVFKTFEGEMVSRATLDGSGKIYSRGSSFSVEEDSIGERLQAAKLSGKPVTITYKRYYGALPWRGNSTTFITAVAADEP